MRLGVVVPRYGGDIVGGAESLMRDYAERLAAAGHSVEVLTTCARNHFTWRNELPAGRTTIRGVTVRRFRVSKRKDHGAVASLQARLRAGFALDAAGEQAWVENTGYSDDLFAAIDADADRLDALLFAPYLFASTVFGARIRPQRSLIVPCLHDESFARFALIQDTLCAAAGLIFNTAAEKRLAGRLLGESLPSNRVVGGGFAPPDPQPAPERWRRLRAVSGDLVAYAGRRELGKNFPLLAQWVTVHSRAIAPHRPVRLAAMGSGPLGLPRSARDLVVDLGRVSESEKFNVMAASIAVAQLSVNESYSYAIAEGWLSGTPAIVHAHCEVTKEHCQRSGGGVWVESAEEFSQAVSLLQSDPGVRCAMAAAGRDYIMSEYGWPSVLSHLVNAVEELVA